MNSAVCTYAHSSEPRTPFSHVQNACFGGSYSVFYSRLKEHPEKICSRLCTHHAVTPDHPCDFSLPAQQLQNFFDRVIPSVFQSGTLLFTFVHHDSNPSPSSGRVRSPEGSIHVSPLHAFHCALAKWISTIASRQLSSNRFSQVLLIYSHPHASKRRKIRYFEQKNRMHLARLEPVFSLPSRRQVDHQTTRGATVKVTMREE